MASISNGRLQNGKRAEYMPVARYVEGVILLDSRLRVLAFDGGAATILRSSMAHDAASEWIPEVPQEILDVLQNGQMSEPLSRKFRIQIDTNTYICRIHVAHSCMDGPTGHVTVLHLARELSLDDSLTLISAEYRLTVREQQALRLVLTGLTSKEVAEQMCISPNTVKAFLRLVMGKMGVSSRTGIVAKLFHSNGNG